VPTLSRIGLFLGAILALALYPHPLTADQGGPRLPPGAPDLVVGRDSLSLSADGRQLEVTVANRGSLPSGPTRVLLVDRLPLIASRNGEALHPHHLFRRNERSLVFWPERAAGGFLLHVRWHGSSGTDFFSGRVRLESSAGATLQPAALSRVGRLRERDVVRSEDGWVSWNADTGNGESGFDLRLPPGEAPASFTVDRLSLNGVANVRETYIGNWWITRYFREMVESEVMTSSPEGEAHEAEAFPGPGPVTIPLDDVRLAHVSVPARVEPGLWMEKPLPSLDPGGQSRLVFPLDPPVGDPGDLYVQVDPDNEVVEIREGNNTASRRRPGRRAMVSLHTHASLSEGTASVDTQMDLLTRSGYDAVFWTEHDWRVTAHEYQPVFGFEGALSHDDILMVPKRRDRGLDAEVGLTRERFTEGRQALRFRAERKAAPDGKTRQAAFALHAYRGRHIRSLAQDLSLSFDIYPDLDQPYDSEFTIELELSDQPHVKRSLLYRVEALPVATTPAQVILPAPPAPEEPVRVAIRPGRWTRLVIPVTEHARVLFPEGVDNALTSAQFGVAVYRGSADWDMDRLVMEAAVTGDPLLAWQEEWARFYPAISSHVTTEISYYIPHLNPFTSERFLLDYNQVPPNQYIPRSLEETRLRDGALSLNHPLGFGIPYASDHIENQIRFRLFGADLLEAGYRYRGGTDLEAHLKFWDRALAEGIPVSGIGVTDAHGPGRGNGFQRDENNFATWVAADPSSVDSLIDGLLDGDLVFGDPLLFEGSLDLVVDGSHRPGAVILSEGRARQVSFEARELPAGSRLDLVVDGQVAASAETDGSGAGGGSHALAPSARSVRLESWDPRGEPIAFTSAVVFLPELPPDGLTAGRLRAETPWGELSGKSRYRISSLQVGPDGMKLHGKGRPSSLTIRGAGREPATVTVAGSDTVVVWSHDPEEDTLTIPLAGAGIDLRWPARGLPIPGGWLTVGVAGAVLAVLMALLINRRRRRSSRF
jgi:hypothetical protein